MKKFLATVLPCILAGVAALDAADWNQPPFPEWSEQTVLKIVTDSPWAKPKTVKLSWTKGEERDFSYKDVPGVDSKGQLPGGSPVGGIGVPKHPLPDHADVIIRWASSLPVRQAKALYKLRDERLEPGRLSALIEQPSPDYVLEIYGLPAEVAHKGTGSVEMALKQSTYLRTKSGRTIRPSSVEATLHGTSVNVLIHFPRTEAIGPDDKEIECSGDVQLFGFKAKFPLGPMVYLNHLEM